MRNDELREQLDERLKQIENNEWSGIDHMQKKDYVFAAICVAVGIAILILGAFIF